MNLLCWSRICLANFNSKAPLIFNCMVRNVRNVLSDYLYLYINSALHCRHENNVCRIRHLEGETCNGTLLCSHYYMIVSNVHCADLQGVCKYLLSWGKTEERKQTKQIINSINMHMYSI